MKQTIEIEGLPEGWKATKIEVLDCAAQSSSKIVHHALIQLEKIQPRRIVLEETDRTQPVINENGNPQWFYLENKWWKEVKE